VGDLRYGVNLGGAEHGPRVEARLKTPQDVPVFVVKQKLAAPVGAPLTGQAQGVGRTPFPIAGIVMQGQEVSRLETGRLSVDLGQAGFACHGAGEGQEGWTIEKFGKDMGRVT